MDILDIIHFSFCSEMGKKEEASEQVAGELFCFLLQVEEKGGYARRRGGSTSPRGYLQGGAKYFLGGPKCPPSSSPPVI